MLGKQMHLLCLQPIRITSAIPVLCTTSPLHTLAHTHPPPLLPQVVVSLKRLEDDPLQETLDKVLPLKEVRACVRLERATFEFGWGSLLCAASQHCPAGCALAAPPARLYRPLNSPATAINPPSPLPPPRRVLAGRRLRPARVGADRGARGAGRHPAGAEPPGGRDRRGAGALRGGEAHRQPGGWRWSSAVGGDRWGQAPPS